MRGATAGLVLHASHRWLRVRHGRKCRAMPLSLHCGEPPLCHSAQMRECVPPAVIDLPNTHAASTSWPVKRCSSRRSHALMQNSTAGGSAGSARAVSHSDACDPAHLRKRTRSATAVDLTCDDALRVCLERCKEGSCTGVGVCMYV